MKKILKETCNKFPYIYNQVGMEILKDGQHNMDMKEYEKM